MSQTSGAYLELELDASEVTTVGMALIGLVH
jgi:hypothetical protein